MSGFSQFWPTAPLELCPRCTSDRARAGQGEFWCCWQLIQLKHLMAQPKTPTMREVLGVFVGKTAKSVDGACRRFGLKIPARDRKPRRKRCFACRGLFAPAEGEKVCGKCAVALDHERERRAA